MPETLGSNIGGRALCEVKSGGDAPLVSNKMPLRKFSPPHDPLVHVNFLLKMS